MSGAAFDFSQGTDKVYCFVDDEWSAIMVKVVSAGVDPVELNPNEAREFAAALMTLADRLEQHDAVP